MNLYYLYLYLFFFSFFLSYIFTLIAKKIAIKFSVFAYPGKRRIHTYPIPLLGGIAIFFAIGFTVLINLLLFFLCKTINFSISIESVKNVLGNLTTIILGGFIILILGLADDLKKVSFLLKLFIQIIVALAVVISGTKLDIVPNIILKYILTILWIVGISNSFNLLDNMDGISAGVAFIASFLFFILAVTEEQYLTAMLILTFNGAILGFLKFNFPPAKIFMGDAGSLFLGYFLGTLSVTSSYFNSNCKTFISILAPLLILALPILDTFFVIYIRLVNKKPIYKGDNNHITHRLAFLGLTYRQIAVFIYLITFAIGSGALLLSSLSFIKSLLVLLQTITILGIVLLLVTHNIINKKNKFENGK